MSLRVDSGAGSRDAAVDGQCLWVANVANAVNLGLAGPEEDDDEANVDVNSINDSRARFCRRR